MISLFLSISPENAKKRQLRTLYWLWQHHNFCVFLFLFNYFGQHISFSSLIDNKMFSRGIDLKERGDLLCKTGRKEMPDNPRFNAIGSVSPAHSLFQSVVDYLMLLSFCLASILKTSKTKPYIYHSTLLPILYNVFVCEVGVCSFVSTHMEVRVEFWVYFSIILPFSSDQPSYLSPCPWC